LLRVIETREFERLGGRKTIKLDVRLIRADECRPRGCREGRTVSRGPAFTGST
jgi:transcriptional regulator with PAS, ATPase and Fis domain